MDGLQKPLTSLGLATSFRGLDTEITGGGAVRQGFSISTPCSSLTPHSLYCLRAKPNKRQETVLLEAVVVEAGRQACFWGKYCSYLSFLFCIPSLATAVRLPQLSSTRHTAAAQG